MVEPPEKVSDAGPFGRSKLLYDYYIKAGLMLQLKVNLLLRRGEEEKMARSTESNATERNLKVVYSKPIQRAISADYAALRSQFNDLLN